MTGSITRRGRHSWRLKFDVARDATGKRSTAFLTVRGTKKEAQEELNRLLFARDSGTLVNPSKLTVADTLDRWIDHAAATGAISPKTAERYKGLAARQIKPHLGNHLLQKLKAAHLSAWHAALMKGGEGARPIAARTTGHAHRLLSAALNDAIRQELVVKNVAALVSPPKIEAREMRTLSAEEVRDVLDGMRDTVIFPQIVILLATGIRRGELTGLQWSDVDFDAGKLRVERSIEKTKSHGLRVKAPKTKHGRRRITLPAGAVAVLRQHRADVLEIRLALGIGRLPDDAYVFGTLEGGVRDPDRITQDWKRFTAERGLPRVTLHALRHSHASALIARGTDAVTVSRRLGHGSPNVTMSVYAHVFDRSDEAAAEAIDSLLDIPKS
jgi:integrase